MRLRVGRAADEQADKLHEAAAAGDGAAAARLVALHAELPLSDRAGKSLGGDFGTGLDREAVLNAFAAAAGVDPARFTPPSAARPLADEAAVVEGLPPSAASPAINCCPNAARYRTSLALFCFGAAYLL